MQDIKKDFECTETSMQNHLLADNPLFQLQRALERSRIFGMKTMESDCSPPKPMLNSVFNGAVNIEKSAKSLNASNEDISDELYRCHLCSYSGNSKYEFNAHMNTHFDHKCPLCDYTSRTEGRLKRHIRDFHSEVPPESWAGTRVLHNSEETNDASNNSSSSTNRTLSSGGSGKSRKYKCKQCNFIAVSKSDFWEHSKSHIKSEKLLTCPKCQFVTEYKHHLEYHLRNHFGSKPFKCAKCNYSCVNKSMLNSHMKSHSNIYQYRCSECSYATKYCHSLKLHLRKYSHKPATVLNLDGTPNPYPIIDVYGTRRGPRPKKRSVKDEDSPTKETQSKTSNNASAPDYLFLPNSSVNTVSNQNSLSPLPMPMEFPFFGQPLFPNGLLNYSGLGSLASNSEMFPFYNSQSISSMAIENPAQMSSTNCKEFKDSKVEKKQSGHIVPLKCSFCDFTTETREQYGKHLLQHVAEENRNTKINDPLNISSSNDVSNAEIEQQQKALFNELMARQSSSPNSRKLLEQITANPMAANIIFNGCGSNIAHEESLKLNRFRNKESESDLENFQIKNKRPISAPVERVMDLNKLLSSPPPRAKSSPCFLSPASFESTKYDDTNAQSKMTVPLTEDASPLDLSSNRKDENVEDDSDNESCPSPDEMYAIRLSSNTPVDENDCENNKKDFECNEMSQRHPLVDNPLFQLQSAFERSSIFGVKKKESECSPNPMMNSVFNGAVNIEKSKNFFNTASEEISGELYRCHLCSYSGNSKYEFNAHMNTHFDHKCPLCDYTSRTEGRLKRHIRDFHSEVPPESWAGTRVLHNSEETNDASNNSSSSTNRTLSSGGSGKSRKYKCKQCNFIAVSKSDFWEHSKSHIKSEKLLTCPKCQFVTEYKHHLEYHLRNHFGSKPFKCAKCNYSCVNKSMLNSHMKSHSNIYQYRCSECSYATKYCHSLKLHLRKYSHKPATVLNLDGTPNPYPVIDVYGTRRGPRPKKQQGKNDSPIKEPQPKSSIAATVPSFPFLQNAAIDSNLMPLLMQNSMPMGIPFLCPPLITNSMMSSSTFGGVSSHSDMLFPFSNSHPISSLTGNRNSILSHSTINAEYTNESNFKNSKDEKKQSNLVPLKCSFCDYTTETRELYGQHLILHVAEENMNSTKNSTFSPSNHISEDESEKQQRAFLNELIARSHSPNSRKLLEQITANPMAANVIFNSYNGITLQNGSNRIKFEGQEMSSEANYLDSDNRPVSAPVDLKKLLSPPPRAKSSPCFLSPTLSLDESKAEQSSELPKLTDTVNEDASPLDLSSYRLPQDYNRNNYFSEEQQANDERQQFRRHRRKGEAVKLSCLKIDGENSDED
ncbi:hunchback-like protein [Dinothrombium tinctorium]|uniref:Protein hunchback n=1 Tax=Dinothrombium tinctorium TaxID=1965070 RepID=A0A3S3S6S3_9ACAR|nr:hunchback-like protein [Dinothrombium tinctorium]